MGKIFTIFSPRRCSVTRRFWKSVKKGPSCWFWTASTTGTRKNYGNFCIRGKVVKAHRASWVIHNGDIPDGLVVRHKCDNGLCVNPDHLELGTQMENVHDCISRGRAVHVSGDDHPRRKLKKEYVLRIREMYNSGEKDSIQLGKMFGVNGSAIRKIMAGTNWNTV